MKTIIIGRSPAYLRTCTKVCREAGLTSLSEFDDVFKAHNQALIDPPQLVVSNIFDGDLSGWDTFHAYVKESKIPLIFCAANPSDQMIDYTINQDGQGIFDFPNDITSFKFFVKQLKIKDKEKLSNEFLVIRHNRMFVKLPQKSISKIVTQGNYSYVYVASGKKYVIKKPLVRLLEKLDKEKIIQCHRSTAFNIVMLERLELVDRKVILVNGDILKLGNNYKQQVKRAMIAQYD